MIIMKEWRVAEALRWAADFLEFHRVPDPHIDAGVLLAYALGWERKELFIHPERVLSGVEMERFRRMIDRRARREPVQYIVGEVEFLGRRFKVDRDVLIPRPETELLVEEAIDSLEKEDRDGGERGITVLDLCTGSGCIAVSIAREIPYSRVYAVDISEGALEVARENAERHGVGDRIIFLPGDLFEGIEHLGLEGEIDLVISNPPYVSKKDIETLQPEVKEYEPLQALYGGEDGLDFYRKIIEESPFYLAHDGFLILEIGYDQSDNVVRLLEEEGSYRWIEVKKDLAGIDRIIKARKGPDRSSHRR